MSRKQPEEPLTGYLYKIKARDVYNKHVKYHETNTLRSHSEKEKIPIQKLVKKPTNEEIDNKLNSPTHLPNNIHTSRTPRNMVRRPAHTNL